MVETIDSYHTDLDNFVIEHWIKSNDRIPKIDWRGERIEHSMFINNEVDSICEYLQSDGRQAYVSGERAYAPFKKMSYPVWLWCLSQDTGGWSYTAVCIDNNERSAILVQSERGICLGYL